MWRLEPKAVTSEARVVRAVKRDLEDLRSFQTADQVARFAAMLDGGESCYLAYLGNQCVHRSFVRSGPATVRVHPLVVESQPTGHAYVHYCETTPCARGRGVFPAVLSKIARDYTTETIWTAVNSRNAASLAAMRKAGFVAVRRIKVRFLLGLRRVTAEPMEMQT